MKLVAALVFGTSSDSFLPVSREMVGALFQRDQDSPGILPACLAGFVTQLQTILDHGPQCPGFIAHSSSVDVLMVVAVGGLDCGLRAVMRNPDKVYEPSKLGFGGGGFTMIVD